MSDAVFNQARAKYANIDAIRVEIRSVLSNYSGLRLENIPYVYNTGHSDVLLTLKGVIPVPYRGVKYNIPIAIRLLSGYPHQPPLCSVEPTSDMRINVSKYVGHDGRIYLPYLHEWRAGTSDLSGLIQVMTSVFMETTPLNSVVNSPPTPQPSMQPPGCPYPLTPNFLPMPGVGGPTGSSSGPTPPYPTSNPAIPLPSSGSSNSSQPPYPLRPPSFGPSSGPVAVKPPYPVVGPVTATSTTSSSYGPGSSATITEEHRKASLLSAVEDKVRRKLGEIFQQYQAEMGVLKKTQKELVQGETKINSILAKLNREKTELDQKMDQMREKKKEIEEALAKMEQHQGEVNVDEAVVPTAPLYKQIFELYAEENATQDAIYYLGEGLRRNVVDLETYLKQVRELSRKQFLLRAHMQKCRKVARLAG